MRLLEAAVADPERAIGRLDILGAEERATILREWNATARAVPCATLPELFAAQVARTPEAVAVVFEEERLSYGELDARSNRLAHHLRALGVGPEVVVGLCIERSLECSWGLLGILKAGGAYLPLDPDYPPERLAFMLADAGAPVLVTQRRCGAPAGATARVCRSSCGSMPMARHRAAPQTAPAAALDPGNPAYVIYTSGSTGTPKGVAVVTHAGHSQSLQRADRASAIAPAARVAAICVPQLRCRPISEICDRLCSGASARRAACDRSRSGAADEDHCSATRCPSASPTLPPACWPIARASCALRS